MFNRIGIFALAALLGWHGAVTNAATSTFDSSLEEWTLAGNPALSHQATGGNPGGFARYDDHSGPEGDGWIIAPSEFLGDWSAMDDVGTLSWDHLILDAGDGVAEILHGEAVISGPGGSARYVSATPFAEAWTSFVAPITQSSWSVTDGSWQALLTDVTELRLRIEAVWNGGPALDVTGIDNVALSRPQVRPGFTLEVFASISNPIGITADSVGNLYVGNDPPGGSSWEPARIRFVSHDGSTVCEIGDLIPDPDTVVVDHYGYLGAPGNVLVGAGPSIWQVDPITGATSEVLSGPPLANVAQMAFDSTGRLIVCAGGPDVVSVVAGSMSVLASFPGRSPAGVAIDGDDNIFICHQTGELYLLDSSGSEPPEHVAGIPGGIVGLAYTPSGILSGHIMAADLTGTVYSVDPDTGEVLPFATGFSRLEGIAYGPTGDLFIGDPEVDRIYRVTSCFGDLDADGDVDLADLARLLGQYGETSGMTYEDGDLDGDGDVDLADLAELLGVYGEVCE
ncbi:MAG: hypothetical protein KJ749_00725 [Planctomycetes bacterium]|nr:hypothetical protein [Planctomycetota bacterium]